MYEVVTFGEAMVRLSPPNFQRLEQTRSLNVNIGGAELNVAVGVTRFGLKSAWVSKLPKNGLGYMIRDRAQEFGVDCSHIVWSDRGRAGLYFVEFGASPRASSVLYDRANSAISMIQPGEVDWAKIFTGSKHFHISGITPALSPSAAQVTTEAMMAAKKAGCTVSYDLNYRKKLWTPADAKKIQEPMMSDVDILITTEEDTHVVFGIKEKDYEAVAEKLAKTFRFKVVAITLREDLSVWRNNWTAIAFQEGKLYKDRKYEVEIVDRVGAGDSFTSGFLYGWIKEKDVQRGVQYGNAFAALKHTIPGDFNWNTLEEVEAQMKGAGLRISR
ncbi:MAG: carbohydrate kinase [Deltaproteobacteria bacterium RBG_16_48_10]|nr:MAG: carbohydrate kinase [Deltaproteobacteria bacterium RBG_16_48_10]